MTELTGKMAPPQTVKTLGGAATQQPNAKPSDPSKATNAIQAVGAPFQIQTMHERTRWLKLLVYGKHGAGKTELAASAIDVPAMRDVLFVDAESGDSTLEDSTRITHADKIHHVRVQNFNQVKFVLGFLNAYCKAREKGDMTTMKALYARTIGVPAAEIADDQVPQYKTVIVDSLTEVEQYCLYSLLSIDTGKEMANDIEVAGWPEYRKNNDIIKLLVRGFRDLPMHVIFVCAEQYTQDEQKKFHYSPQLTGKLSAQVQGFVDIVGWITVGQATQESPEAPRRVYVQPISGGPKFDAKNRRAIYKQAFFENPSITSIMKDTGFLKS